MPWPAQIPVILLGMLGVDKRYQGEGFGRDLLLDAVHRAGYVSEQVGAKALIVDPLMTPPGHSIPAMDFAPCREHHACTRSGKKDDPKSKTRT